MSLDSRFHGKSASEEARERRRQSIIDAAEALFLDHDLIGVTMKDISAAAGITKATLYKYFASIDAIAFEVQIRVYAMMFDGVEVEQSHDSLRTGKEIVQQYLLDNVAFAEQHPHHVRYLGMFDHHYRDRYPTSELERRYKVIVNRVTTRHVNMLSQGMADGSIRNDIEPNLLASGVWNILMPVLQRMALRGHIIQRESGVSPDQILPVVLDVIMTYLSPN